MRGPETSKHHWDFISRPGATSRAAVRCIYNGMNGDAYAAGQHALTGAQEQGTGIGDAREAGSRSGN